MFRLTLGMLVVVGLQLSAAAQFRVLYPKEDARIGAALEAGAKSAYSGTVREVLAEMADNHNIPVIVDEQAVADGRRDLDLTIELDLEEPSDVFALRNVDPEKGVTLADALEVILKPLGMTYLAEDGVLKVTTKEVAAGKILLRAYEVGPVLGDKMTATEVSDSVARLAIALGRSRRGEIDGVRSTTEAPPPEVVPIRTTLIVAGTPAQHDNVAQALAMMGQIRGR